MPAPVNMESVWGSQYREGEGVGLCEFGQYESQKISKVRIPVNNSMESICPSEYRECRS